MTTGNFVTDSTIADMQRKADAAAQEMQELVDKLNKLQEAAASRTFSGKSANSMVTATVNGAGKLLTISIGAVDRRRPQTEQLSADLTAAIRAARSTASAEVNKRVHKILPGFFE